LSAGNGKYDAIVIGAGQNGLTAAAMLARSGRNVVVLENRDVAGGMCAGEEFHPGYRTAGLLHDTTGVRQWVADELRLHEHGLARADEPLEVFSPRRDGRGLALSRDPGRAAGEIGAFSPQDAMAYEKRGKFIEKVRGVVSHVMNEVPADLLEIGAGGVVSMLRQAMSIRRLGRRDMIELIRISPMCVADWLNESFETELVKSSLAMPAILGGWVGPWSPGTSTNLLLWECLAGNPVQGGPATVVFALERAAKHMGAGIRTGCTVEQILTAKNRVKGVRLVGGEELEAPMVLSSCDPKTTFLDLLAPHVVAPKLEARIRSWRARGTTAKVHLALDKPLEFACRPGEIFEYIRTGETLDELERAFDPVKYRTAPGAPALDIFVPSVSRPEMAPDGHATVSIMAHFFPHEYDAEWSDDERNKLGDTVVASLETYAPGVSGSIVGREVLTPLDIEQRYGTTGGHIYHGEHGLDQIVVRPTPETARYTTPIKGLILCGSGAFAGGGVSCVPGALAAQTALKND